MDKKSTTAKYKINRGMFFFAAGETVKLSKLLEYFTFKALKKYQEDGYMELDNSIPCPNTGNYKKI